MVSYERTVFRVLSEEGGGGGGGGEEKLLPKTAAFHITDSHTSLLNLFRQLTVLINHSLKADSNL